MWFGPALLVAGLAVGTVGGAVLEEDNSAAAGLVWVASMAMLVLGAALCIAAAVGLVVGRNRRAGS